MAAMSYCQWQFLLVALAGWVNRHQQDVKYYHRRAARWYTMGSRLLGYAGNMP
jgi:hypothetical protein